MDNGISMKLTAEDIKAQQSQPEVEVCIVDTPSYMKLFDEMMEFIKTPKMQELKITSPENYHNKINLKNNGELSYAILRLIDEDINNEHKIREMLSVLDECRTGKKDIKKETDVFNEKVSEDYLFPSFVGKENYYKKITEMEEKAKEEKAKEETETSVPIHKKKELKKARFAGGKRV